MTNPASRSLPLADLWDRIAARFVDALIVTAVWVAAAAVHELAMVAAGVAIVVWEVLWLVNRGATPGKLLMGTRVVQADGSPIELGGALLRSVDLILLTAISIGSPGASAYGRLYYLTSLVVLAVDADLRRSIMDHIAKTRVVSV